MRKAILMYIALLLILILVVPSIIVRGCQKQTSGPTVAEKKQKIVLFNTVLGKTQKISLYEYLVGVVAAEMPARFEEEALKAQAIAARTYVIKRLNPPLGSRYIPHPKADICSDPAHCQGWISRAEMKKRWGAGYRLFVSKIENAVRATAGAVVYYNGEIIDPLYHASCGGGGTENAEEIWKNQVPYLRAVDCPEDPDAPQIKQEITFTEGQLQKLLRNSRVFPVKEGQKTSTGRWKTLIFGSQQIEAQKLRTILGLKSSSFTWETKDDSITFHVTGYGHGVGLCQRGANALAQQGKTYKEILEHYYTGAKVMLSNRELR